MNESKIIDSNKLIAEFMGVKIVKRNQEDAVFMFDKAAFPEYFRCTKYNTYNSDWNLLMPVIEEIEILGYRVNINGLCCSIEKQNGEVICYAARFEDKKNTCYNSVISFINWFNTRILTPPNDKNQ